MNEQETKRSIEGALKNFPNAPLADAGMHLFEILGYTSRKRLKITPTVDGFMTAFAPDKTMNDTHALSSEWRSIEFLFQLTDEELRDADGMRLDFGNDTAVNRSNINSYLFFAIEFNGEEYTRTALAGITREVNKLFPMPALILFRHGKSLTLSIINRRRHKREESKDVLEKVTLIQDIQCMTPHRAHIEILFDLSLGALHDKHSFTNFDGL